MTVCVLSVYALLVLLLLLLPVQQERIRVPV
jgi:hypothetical protein